MNKRNLNFKNILSNINKGLIEYFTDNNIKTVIIGVSGGLDSALNSVILKPICDKLGITIVGRYIHIETNKEDEQFRANEIGKYFIHDFKSIDLTKLYHESLPVYEENFEEVQKNITYNDKIRRGNIKARMRMIYLFNLSSQYPNGLVIDNDNMTEHLLGFWTLNGDVGTLTPLASLFKTEVFELAKYILNELKDENQKNALELCINAIPTDGLGITSSDVEQFGTKSYDEVDDILLTKLGFIKNDNLHLQYSNEIIDKVYQRHLHSNFKRNCPYKINSL